MPRNANRIANPVTWGRLETKHYFSFYVDTLSRAERNRLTIAVFGWPQVVDSGRNTTSARICSDSDKPERGTQEKTERAPRKVLPNMYARIATCIPLA